MYNLYVERKKLQEIKRKELDKIRLTKQAKIHKNKTKILALKYEERLRKFIISVINNIYNIFSLQKIIQN